MAKPLVGLTLTGADADLSLLSFYFIFDNSKQKKRSKVAAINKKTLIPPVYGRRGQV